MTATESLLRAFKLADDFYWKVNPERVGILPSCSSCCAQGTPVATYLEAKYILSSLSDRANDIYLMSMSWLSKPHAGLEIYERIRGRVYTAEEADKIALEVEKAKHLPCPYYDESRGCFLRPYRPFLCCVEGLDQESVKTANYFRNQMQMLFKQVAPELGVVGFLPALIAREIDKEALTTLIDKGEIADAKLAITQRLPEYGSE